MSVPDAHGYTAAPHEGASPIISSVVQTLYKVMHLTGTARPSATSTTTGAALLVAALRRLLHRVRLVDEAMR